MVLQRGSREWACSCSHRRAGLPGGASSLARLHRAERWITSKASLWDAWRRTSSWGLLARWSLAVSCGALSTATPPSSEADAAAAIAHTAAASRIGPRPSEMGGYKDILYSNTQYQFVYTCDIY